MLVYMSSELQLGELFTTEIPTPKMETSSSLSMRSFCPLECAILKKG